MALGVHVGHHVIDHGDIFEGVSRQAAHTSNTRPHPVMHRSQPPGTSRQRKLRQGVVDRQALAVVGDR